MVDAAFMVAAQAAFEQELARLAPESDVYWTRPSGIGSRWVGREQTSMHGPEDAGRMAARDLCVFLSTRRVVSSAGAPVVVATGLGSGIVGFAWRFDGAVERLAGKP